MSKAVLIFVALIAIGCASTSKMYLPDGRQGYAFNCSGLARSWNMCMSAAGEQCKERGYDVISANGERGLVATQTMAGSTISRTLVVACKN